MIVRRFLYRLAFKISWILPLKAAYFLADVLAFFNFVFARKSRKAVISNLKIIFPDKSQKEIQRLALQNYIKFGRNLAELFRLHRTNKKIVASRSDISDTQILKEYSGKEQGLIVATAHFCNWELSGALISYQTKKMHSIALPDPDKKINKYYVRARNAIDNETIALKNAPRTCLKLLKNGKTLAILGDRKYTAEGIELDFFGKRTSFPTGIARFALKTNAAVVPYFITRTGTGRYKGHCPPHPITIPEQGTKEEKIKQIMQEYVKTLEEKIREHPEFWFTFYKFWSEEPTGSTHGNSPVNT